MSTTSGTAAKRAGMPLAAAEASPKRPRSSRHPSLSPSPSPSQSRSLAPSPSQSRSPVPLAETSPQSRSRSPVPLAETSPLSRSRSPPPLAGMSPPPRPGIGSSERDAYDDLSPRRSRSLSRSHLSEETDGHGLVWRPHSYNGEHGDGEYSVRISDYDRLFTCRVCRRMLTSPVYECSSGHVTCVTCHGETEDTLCTHCVATGVTCHGETEDTLCTHCVATGCTRSRAVEGFLRRISFSCRNQQYGCGAFLPHHQMRAHERSCRHEPCFCPVPRCAFAGGTKELESHLATLHRWDVVKFRYGESFEAPVYRPAFFRCEDYGELFHIVSDREGHGTALSMICIRPDNAVKEEFTYELKMPAGARHRLQMQSTVWNTSLRYGVGEGSDVFLLVPDKLPGIESGALEVCINKAVPAGAAGN